jgi:hypothetical protein
MDDKKPDTRSPVERVKDARLVQRALARAFRAAVLQHKQAGNPICVGRDGKVVWIPPEEIEIPNEPID